MTEVTYLTPYAAAIRWLGQNLSDDAFKTFFMEFAHIDKYGTCWAGYSRLEDLTRHNRTCIFYEMQEIMAHDLVRVLEEPKQDKYGRWQPRLYQINPYLLYLSDENFAEALTRWNSVEQTIEQKVPVFGLNSIDSYEAAESEASPTSNAKQHLQQATPSSSSSSSSSRTSPESEMQNAGGVAKWQRQKQSAAKQQREAPQTKTDVPPPPREKYPDITPVPRPLSMSHEEELAIKVASGIDMAIRLVRGLITMYGFNAVSTAYNDPFVGEASKPAGALRSVLQKQQRVEQTEVSTKEQLDSFEQTHAALAERWQRENAPYQSEIEI